MEGLYVAELQASAAAARFWVGRAFRRRGKLVVLAMVFNAIGPALALLTTGVLAQLAPPSSHQFGAFDYAVGGIPFDLVVPYRKAAAGAEVESGFICDGSGVVGGVATRIRGIDGVSAVTVGMTGQQARLLEPNGVALSESVARLVGVGVDDMVTVNGEPRRVVSTSAFNPGAVDELLAVVPWSSVNVDSCTVILSDDAAGAIWTSLGETVDPDRLFSLPGEAQSRAEFESRGQITSIWLIGTVLALLAGATVSASVWGLLLPGLIGDGLALIILGIEPRHLRVAVARRVASYGGAAVAIGSSLGYAVAYVASFVLANADHMVRRTPILSPAIVAATIAMAFLTVIAQAIRLSRPLGANDLQTEAKRSPLVIEPWRSRLPFALTGALLAVIGFSSGKPLGHALGLLAGAVALRQLALAVSAASRVVPFNLIRLAASDVSRSRRLVAPAAAMTWLAVGLGTFIAVFAAVEVERGRMFPEVPPGVAMAAAEWDWATASGLNEPTAAPSSKLVRTSIGNIDDLEVVVARRVGRQSSAETFVAFSPGQRLLPLYVADPDLLQLLGIDLPPGVAVFWTGDEPLTVAGPPGSPTLRALPVEGNRSRVAPRLFITPSELKRLNLDTFDAAVLITGPAKATQPAIDELARTGVTIRSHRPATAAWLFLAFGSILILGALSLSATTHRQGLMTALHTQGTQLSVAGMTTSWLNRLWRTVALLSALSLTPIILAVGALPIWLLIDIEGFQWHWAMVTLLIVQVATPATLLLTAPRMLASSG